MSQPSGNPPSLPNYSDEVDLLELMRFLWKKKRLIMLIALFTTSLAAIYAFTAQEQWTAKAYVVAPRTEDIKSLLDIRREYARSMDESTDISGTLSNDLFTNFIQLARSPDEKIKFLQQSDYYQQQTNNLSNLLAKRKWLELQIDKKLLITSPDAKKGNDYYVISMQADSAMAAKEIVEQYIQFSSQNSLAKNNYEFNDRITSMILSLQKEQSNIESELKIARERTIKEVSDALEVARTTGIKDYKGGSDSLKFISNSEKFMLGETILSAELNNLQQSPLVYPYRYYQIGELLGSLKPLNNTSSHNDTAQAYRYELAPELPTTQDAPKRALIILLGVLLGVGLAAGSILIRFMLLNSKDNRRI